IIHEDTGETLTDRAVEKQRHHCGIDPTTQPADNPTIPDPLADLAGFTLDEPFHRPSGFAVANTEQKVMQDLSSPFRVPHLRMELNAEEAATRSAAGGKGRVRRMGKEVPTRRQRLHLVTMTHPYPGFLPGQESSEQVTGILDNKLGRAELAPVGLCHHPVSQL